MKTRNRLTLELKKSAGWTFLVTLLFILFYCTSSRLSDIVTALPFFILFYFLFFSLGRGAVLAKFRNWIQTDIKKVILLPSILLALYFIYILINGQNPLRGALALIPYLILFPALLFFARMRRDRKIDWIDFTAFVLYLLPTTFIEVKPAGELPFVGEGFDSLYRIILILSAVYSFGVVRGLNDIGFFPVFKWRYLWTAHLGVGCILFICNDL